MNIPGREMNKKTSSNVLEHTLMAMTGWKRNIRL